MKISSFEIGSEKLGLSKVGGMEINPGEVCAREVCTGQVAMREVRKLSLSDPPPIPARHAFRPAAKKVEGSVSLHLGGSPAA